MLPIILRDVALFFPHKMCFEHLSAVLPAGARVGISGPNGAGKSTLLRMLGGFVPCSEGHIDRPACLRVAHIPQTLPSNAGDRLSGGQSLYRAIGAALATKPDLLLLDEPTNHLDERHRASLLRLLEDFRGTLVVVSHDEALLRRMNTLWRLHDGTLSIFAGTIDDCLREENVRLQQIKAEDKMLRRERKTVRLAQQHEEHRKAASNRIGQKKFGGDKMQAGLARDRAEKTPISRHLRKQRETLDAASHSVRVPEEIRLHFQLCGERERGNVLTISDGSLTYSGDRLPVLSGLFLTLAGGERLALRGDNGSGKTSILRGILGYPALTRGGFWGVPLPQHSGYLDQHYEVLGDPHHTVLDALREVLPARDTAALRRWLNDFLFRKNAEVSCPVGALSGGEKARLCLALLAARPPRLLLLDEVTNNLDADTRRHVITVLRACPCAMLLVSHDKDFLDAVGVTKELTL